MKKIILASIVVGLMAISFDVVSAETKDESNTNFLSQLQSPDLAKCSAAFVKIRNEKLDSTEVRKALAALLSDQRPGGRIEYDVGVLPPRIEAASLLAKCIGYEPLASKRPLGITDDDVKAFQAWIAANPDKLIKTNKNEVDPSWKPGESQLER